MGFVVSWIVNASGDFVQVLPKDRKVSSVRALGKDLLALESCPHSSFAEGFEIDLRIYDALHQILADGLEPEFLERAFHLLVAILF